MLFLERKFLQRFNDGHKQEALCDFRNLLFHIIDQNDSKPDLIKLKSYLLTLNAILFEYTYKKPSCKKDLFRNRNKIIFQINSKNSLDPLFDIGINMINYYIDRGDMACSLINPIINMAIRYIDDNLDGDLSLTAVAEKLNISHNYLSYLFTDSLGVNFSNYVNLKRINKAKLLLETSNLSLLDIAIECGFNSQSYFCSTFKSFENITPTNYRKSNNKIKTSI